MDFAALELSIGEVAIQNNLAHTTAARISSPLFVKELAVVFLLVIFGLDGEILEDIFSDERIGGGLLSLEGDVGGLLNVVAKQRGQLPGVGIKEKIDTKSSYQEQNHKEAPNAIGDF